jgi:hypothetical protein
MGMGQERLPVALLGCPNGLAAPAQRQTETSAHGHILHGSDVRCSTSRADVCMLILASVVVFSLMSCSALMEGLQTQNKAGHKNKCRITQLR